jgi:glycosyltransferase involved in cell wall biosynthesis
MNLMIPEIARHAREADVIQASSGNVAFPSFIAGSITETPVCCMICHIFGEHWRDVQGPARGKVFEAMEKTFYARDYDKIVFLNNSSKKIGANIGMNMKKSVVMNPGIDYKKFQMKGVKKEPMVMSVGNFSMNKPTVRIKGFEYLIEAAKRLPDTKFVIVGTGPYMSKLKRDVPPNVKFFSNLSDRALIKLYNRALVYCAPSLAEGFGFTILEAMASGCAVVSTIDLGQKGRIIRPKSTDEIVRTIKKLVKTPREAEKIGVQNRKIAKSFSWEKFVDGFEDIYKSLTK